MRWALLIGFFAALLAAQENPLVGAVDALNREDYAAAAPLLEQALESDPDNVEARFNLAFALTQLAQDDRAIAEYEKVLQVKPDLPQALSNLGMVLLRQDRAGDALARFSKLAELRPDDSQAHYLEGHARSRAGNLSDAIASYQRAVQLDPQSALAHLELGQALAGLERFDDAAESYNRAATLDPELASYQFELAERVEQSGDKQKAIELYSAYLAERPDEVAVRERVGFLLLEVERYTEAIVELEKAVEQSPSPANRAALAQAYSLGEEREKALSKWAEAVTAEPGDARLRLRYATSLLNERRYKEAAEQYLETVKLDPNQAEAWSGLGFTLFQAENYSGALKATENAAKLAEPKPAQVYCAPSSRIVCSSTKSQSELRSFPGGKTGDGRRGMEVAPAPARNRSGPEQTMKHLLAFGFALFAATAFAAAPTWVEVEAEADLEKQSRLALDYARAQVDGS